RANQRFDLLDKTAPHRENHAEWLTPLERYRGVLASEFPVHREGKGSPISFDDAGQRLDRVLWLIERSGYHEVIPRLGAEQPLSREGQDAIPEMARTDHRRARLCRP